MLGVNLCSPRGLAGVLCPVSSCSMTRGLSSTFDGSVLLLLWEARAPGSGPHGAVPRGSCLLARAPSSLLCFRSDSRWKPPPTSARLLPQNSVSATMRPFFSAHPPRITHLPRPFPSSPASSPSASTALAPAITTSHLPQRPFSGPARVVSLTKTAPFTQGPKGSADPWRRVESGSKL